MGFQWQPFMLTCCAKQLCRREQMIRVIAWVFGVLGVAVVGLPAWFFVQTEVYYPLRYKVLQARAEEWNRENWQSGTGLVVTVRMMSNAALGNVTDLTRVACFPKHFALEGSIKGPPRVSTLEKSVGPDSLAVPFGPNATLRTELDDLCRDVFRESEDARHPNLSGQHRDYWSRIVANDQSFSCFLGSDPRTSKGEVTHPTILGVKEVPLREILSEAEYEAVPRKSRRFSLTMDKNLYWKSNKEKTEPPCWRRAPGYPCAEGVGQICGKPFRQ